ncbi:hypothetical protein [Paenibacillus amylolyticus]|uniref:hypothetical protein n=1 Tax=Paenibacillus amylolyticus TaxID=1451 RepID=UPI003EC05869
MNNALMLFLSMLAEKVEQDKSIWELYENMPKYDSSNTQHALDSLGIYFPEINTDLMKRYFNYMKNVGVPRKTLEKISIQLKNFKLRSYCFLVLRRRCAV